MLQASFTPYTLLFKEPGGTSRGVMTERRIWLLRITDTASGRVGVGECAPLPGLSVDPIDRIEAKLAEVCRLVEATSTAVGNPLSADALRSDYLAEGFSEARFAELVEEWPAVAFALEMALLDLANGGRQQWFDNAFTRGEASIRINGLIWMGSEAEMLRRIRQKLDAGFSCLKLKIGAIDFATELSLLRGLRREFSPTELEVRVDANGAFRPDEALERLGQLAEFGLHSIEQPIRAGQWEAMARLCEATPLPIALDEELIGASRRDALLDAIRPQYIILKPSLVGGFASADDWICRAEARGIGWWATSALESNVGLTALAQWTYEKLAARYAPGNEATPRPLAGALPQGLGTGQVFTNNFPSHLVLRGERLMME